MKEEKQLTNKLSGHMGRTALLAMAATVHIAAQSPYINKVYDFMPAPGQFVNDLPAYTPGDTKEDMICKVEASIAGAHHNESMISLGGYGGYVVFGFDHPVQNLPGRYDFKILGNAFYANANPNAGASSEGGSCEPGIVMVAVDVNANGLPDDPWYELAGSEYHKTQTLKGYRITYHKPDENKIPEPDPNNPALNDMTYIHWTTNGHGEGYINRNVYHMQSYYPQWLTEESISFEGTKLADNFVDESGNGTYFVQYAYRWGYADNQPNDNDRSGFNIEWAVDANGNAVSLQSIDFVKVYTGVNQNCGWLGETSTEIAGAEDLHLTGHDVLVPDFSAPDPDPGTTPGTDDPDPIPEPDPDPIPQPGDVRVDGVELEHYTLSLMPGEMVSLKAKVTPWDATNREIRWESSNMAVADVTVNGLIVAGRPGTAIITATTREGSYKASCTVTVSYDPVTTGSERIQEASVRYAGGQLYLLHLEGFDCTIVSFSGQLEQSFRVASTEEIRTVDLPKGTYILRAQKGNRRITYKFIVSNTKP
ncbi:MAG: Ig-like domain-containing protein [Tannerellaceae bacterium]|jgi:hypothetical protein|nr:Ig-like domain-containing protein [Tannerellaceae bacterium]